MREPADNPEGCHALESYPNGHRCMTKIIEHLVSISTLRSRAGHHKLDFFEPLILVNLVS